MTVIYKAKSLGLAKLTDRSRLRKKAGALITYIVRADREALEQIREELTDHEYHSDLLHYVRRDGHEENVAATYNRNILSTRPEAIAEEIACLMEAANGGDGLIEHYIVSLREGERLVPHFEEAVDILVEGLGAENCPVVAAVHLDTDNPHFHVMLARVDVKAGAPVMLPEYDIQRCHQSLARMEDRFGWAREENARWKVVNGRLVGDDGTIDLGDANSPATWPDRHYPRPKNETPVEGDRLMTGEEVVRRVVPRLIDQNKTVLGFVNDLASEGIEIAMTGSNASYRIHYVDSEGRSASEQVRPSAIRQWSTSELRKRFGALPCAFGETSLNARNVPDAHLPLIQYRSEEAAFRARANHIAAALRKAIGPSDKASMAAAKSLLAFPSYEDWLAGARPADPAAILAEVAKAPVVGPLGADTIPQPEMKVEHAGFRRYATASKIVYLPVRALIPPTRITHAGDQVVITGPPTSEALELTVRLLKARGFTAVTANGFSSQDRDLLRQIAAKHTVRLIDAVEERRPGELEQPTAIPLQPRSEKYDDDRTAADASSRHPGNASPPAPKPHQPKPEPKSKPRGLQPGIPFPGQDLGR
ncbi:relaxase/mobilization nuclease domain-containing protein [Qipengyuania flava]|uniref:relaxase/mobilization nuclease domain-containing protein n=1 Tax=Qipengyuania flava TaxID=192812 RepID=UPI00273DB9DB|nr:relaxase/mobilization nuclease domain-containing protein [Qipengyuania flava]